MCTKDTRIAVIEAAESLISEKGFDNVSTREIALRAGSANTAVVAYYFGSKEGLIDAVYRHRLTKFELRRKNLFAEIEEAGNTTNIKELFRVLWIPLFEQTDKNGHHSYSGFLANMLSTGHGRTRGRLAVEYPFSSFLVGHINALIPIPLKASLDLRWHIATSIALEALRFIDNSRPADDASRRQIFADAISMGVAAFTAPMSEAELPNG